MNFWPFSSFEIRRYYFTIKSSVSISILTHDLTSVATTGSQTFMPMATAMLKLVTYQQAD